MKTYVLTVSTKFPKTHKRSGWKTYFPEKILSEQIPVGLIDKTTLNKFEDSGYNFDMAAFNNLPSKMHTIRSNYDLWEKRVNEVNDGKAIISIRYWSGKPYNSKQVEFAKLDKDSGIGIQDMYFLSSNIYDPIVNGDEIDIHFLAKNDGLSLDDFKDWFKKYDLSKPMAIIHFTKFRY